MMAESKTKQKMKKQKQIQTKNHPKKRPLEQKQDKLFNRKSPCMLNM